MICASLNNSTTMELLVILFSTFVLTYGKFLPKLDGMIVGGEEANIEDLPYQVSVHYEGKFACGGSILNENTILTACHCVNMLNHKSFSVRVGSENYSKGEEFIVTEVIEHNYYNKESLYDNDVALLKLERPMTFNERVQPIELQPQDEEVPPGVDATISGWGILHEGDDTKPHILHKVDVRIVPIEYCERAYPNYITIHMICASSSLHDACQGDSGGPLVANGRLIGTASWGKGCARPQYPSVYVKISSLHDWILDHIDGYSR